MATISVHGGDQVRKKHNERDYETVKNEKHIDLSRPHENWINIEHRDFYHELFDDALKKYNAKQKRNDRKIKDYYDKIKKDDKKHTVYECIIGVYDSNIKNDIKHDILKEYVDDFEKRNSNFKICGAYYHDDEDSEDCHIHLDYVPIAYQNKRGLEVQTSLTKALNEMGYYTKNNKYTAQIQWFHKERDYLEKLCNERGIKVERNLEKRTHVATGIYKEIKEKSERLENEIVEQVDKINKSNNDVFKDLEKEVNQEIEYPKTKKILTKEYVKKEDYDKLLNKHKSFQSLVRDCINMFKRLYDNITKLKLTRNQLVESAKETVELIQSVPKMAKYIEITQSNEKLLQKVDELENALKTQNKDVSELKGFKSAYYKQQKELDDLRENSVSKEMFESVDKSNTKKELQLRQLKRYTKDLLLDQKVAANENEATQEINQVTYVNESLIEKPKEKEEKQEVKEVKQGNNRFKFDDFEIER